MSSTSPLSPKHLSQSVAFPGRFDALASIMQAELAVAVGMSGERGGTYWVNFHVVGLPSASTMIVDKDCGTPAERYQVQLALYCVWHAAASDVSMCKLSRELQEWPAAA